MQFGILAAAWVNHVPDSLPGRYRYRDFKSWPGGKGIGRGSAGDWAALLKRYGFKDEAEALACKGNPVDELEALATAKIPPIHVVGDADDVVPVAENTSWIESKYEALGGTLTAIHQHGVGHHPHGADGMTPLVEFIMEAARVKHVS
jgi:hypothetical protein